MIEEVRVRPLATPALLLGIGLGGVIDGILIGWSGILLAVTWVLAVVGVILLFRAGRRDDVVWSWRIFLGTMLLGWGMFNVVEGVIDQRVRGIHHTQPGGNTFAWELGFVIIGGVALAVAAFAVYRLTFVERYYDHFVWQASAFLEGQAGIRYPVLNTAERFGNYFFQDVLPIERAAGSERALIPFPPLPAIVLLPFVAAFGLCMRAGSNPAGAERS